MGALHPHQDGILLLRAEAHGQPVGSGAGTLIGGPGKCDEGPALPENICGPGWEWRQRETLEECEQAMWSPSGTNARGIFTILSSIARVPFSCNQ